MPYLITWHTGIKCIEYTHPCHIFSATLVILASPARARSFIRPPLCPKAVKYALRSLFLGIRIYLAVLK